MSGTTKDGEARQRTLIQACTTNGWIAFAAGVCFLYGLLLIALIHTTADGSWFWYAASLRSGQHLYRDLHLALQPLYPLELSLLERGLGTSWIAQQSIGVVNLLLFIAALVLVCRRAMLVAWQRALLIFCGFVTCMAFIMMRFDDFHVVATSFELLCAWLLLTLQVQQSMQRRIGKYAALGLLCGACMLLRINDGGLLFCAVLCVATVFSVARHERLVPLVVVPVCTALTVLAVIVGLGESPRDWWLYSIRAAAAIKGGSSHLWLYPFRLPLGTLREFTRDWRTLALAAYALWLAALAWWWTTRPATRRQRWAALAAGVLPGILLARNIVYGNAARVLVAIVVLSIYAGTALVLWRLYAALRGKPKADWNPAETILLVPLAQLISVSLSGARWYPNTNPPAALMIVLLPLALPWLFREATVRAIFFTWAGLLTLSASVDKIRNPFDWFNYRAHSLNAKRVWLQHPVYGPMLIEAQQLSLMEPVCSAVHSSSQPQLLSLPFTYTNYFCHVPPWHGYVQTFYDLSSPMTIRTLVSQLRTDPPRWIVYQRQLDVLSRNEEAFNGGRPLPHRELDDLINWKLADGEWQATPLQQPKDDASTWLLIRTGRATAQ